MAFRVEQAHDPALKQKLVDYNAEDCEGLRRLVNFVSTLSTLQGASADRDVVDVVDTESCVGRLPANSRRYSCRLPELEAINRAAYWDYQRDKILVKSSARLQSIAKQARTRGRVKLRVNKTFHCPPPSDVPHVAGLSSGSMEPQAERYSM